MTTPVAEQSEKTEIIRNCELFAKASQETLDRVAALAAVQTEPRGTDLFFAGDKQDGLRVVLSGMVRIWMNDSDGRELTVALLEEGDAFGEMALLDDQPRSANATVMESAELLVLTKSAFEELLANDMSLALHLIQALCAMLRQANSDLQGFAFRGLGARLAAKICDLAAAHADLSEGRATFRRRFSQTELANMLGATREAVNKRMAVLVGLNLLEVVKGHIVIPDLAALADWSNTQRRE